MTVNVADRVRDAFARSFGTAPQIVARAPGRVNIIGEHTDYNDGFVFPCAIGFETQVALKARDDGVVRIVAADFGGAIDEFSLSSPIVRSRANPWADYVRGVILEMRREGFGFYGGDFSIAGDIPLGAGLSSSASLEVATALAVAACAGRPDADRTILAKISQRAENDFVGCNCGIMDQLVSAHGVNGAALLIDCRTLKFAPVRAPDHVAILIVHSGVVHGHAAGQYNERRRQCDEAAAALGVLKLRDADERMLAGGAAKIDPVAFRRARHVIMENTRTQRAAAAFAAGDLKQLGALMRASHQSMRDDFEITTPDVDRLADLLNTAIGDEGGARMTGGGFGGAVVGLAHPMRATEIAARIEAAYRRPDGQPTRALIQQPVNGASLILR
jgi:galactokinase